MAKRFIISEEERTDIRSKYNLINEDSEMFPNAICTDTIEHLISLTDYGRPNTNRFSVISIKGDCKVNGVPLRIGSTISLKDKITMKNGSELNLKGIEGWGAPTIRCTGNKMVLLLSWE
jgi:hypothetical protein